MTISTAAAAPGGESVPLADAAAAADCCRRAVIATGAGLREAEGGLMGGPDEVAAASFGDALAACNTCGSAAAVPCAASSSSDSAGDPDAELPSPESAGAGNSFLGA